MRSFIVMVQRGGHDQFMDLLLIGWWWGNWESASSTFWFQLVWGLRAVGSRQLTSPIWWGFQCLQNRSKILLWVSLEGEPGPFPKGAVSWLLLLCLDIPSLPSLTMFEPACWSSGKVMEAEWSLFPAKKKRGTQKDFCALEPHWVLLGFNPPFSLILLNLENRCWTRKGAIVLDRDVNHKLSRGTWF